MRRSTKWLLLGGSVGAAAGLTAAYGVLVRPWHLRWGATDEELRRSMPFDDLIPNPNFFTTRAITIDASPEDVWPFVSDLSALPYGTTVRQAEEKTWIAFVPPEPEAEASWVVVLEPVGDGSRTRLISRNRARFRSTVMAVFRYLVIDPGQFVVESTWMQRIRSRAEELAVAIRTSAPPLAEEVPAKLEPAE